MRLPLLAAVALVAAVCTGAEPDETARTPPSTLVGFPLSRAEYPEYPDAIVRQLWRMASEPRPVQNSAMPPRHLDAEKFPRTLVDRNRIVFGGVGPDVIPAIDRPVFAPAETVDWIDPAEAVLVLQLGNAVRAYPVQVMTWHEIVNDTVAGIPVTVTYCPLCNSGVAFDRRVGGRVLDFGTSGSLYRSALVMYDRQTESLWTHFDGRAVVGTLVGEQLQLLPVSTVGWRDFVSAHPRAPVLTRETGYVREYGRNPYIGYDQSDRPLSGFFTGTVDDRLPAMARVLGILRGDEAVAVATDRLAREGVIEASIGGRSVTIWHAPGTASSLQGVGVADGDDVGATGVLLADSPGETLRFTRQQNRFVDDVTGSTWNILGEAVDGPLAGRRLQPIAHVDTFWFAWSTYHPETSLAR